MAKHSRRGLSKKGLTNLKRITNKEGLRVWAYKNGEFGTLREVVTRFRLDQLGLLTH
jgi:hypothetical protein